MRRRRNALENYRILNKKWRRKLPKTSDNFKLIAYFVESEKRLLGTVDLLAQSRHAFRSKQIERARKLLEELL
jgi:hypothetical protein